MSNTFVDEVTVTNEGNEDSQVADFDLDKYTLLADDYDPFRQINGRLKGIPSSAPQQQLIQGT